MEVHLNGRMIPLDQATLNVQDAGFQHAVGLFETMLARHGRVFRLEAHLARLDRSARELGLARQLDLPALAKAVNQTLTHNHLQEARLRLTVTAGNLSLLGKPPTTEINPTVLVVPSPPTQYDPAYFDQGITVLVAPAGANPFDAMAGHKALNYWPRLRTLRQAAAVGAGEAIWLNVTNHLASGAVSNLFIMRDGVLLTPYARGEEVAGALPAPVLPGITRQAVIELAEAQGLAVERRMLSISDLLDADEVFLTNSSWLLLPVTRVEKQPVGQGEVGPMTRQLRERLLALVEKETQAGPPDMPAASPQNN